MYAKASSFWPYLDGSCSFDCINCSLVNQVNRQRQSDSYQWCFFVKLSHFAIYHPSNYRFRDKSNQLKTSEIYLLKQTHFSSIVYFQQYLDIIHVVRLASQDTLTALSQNILCARPQALASSSNRTTQVSTLDVQHKTTLSSSSWQVHQVTSLSSFLFWPFTAKIRSWQLTGKFLLYAIADGSFTGAIPFSWNGFLKNNILISLSPTQV